MYIREDKHILKYTQLPSLLHLPPPLTQPPLTPLSIMQQPSKTHSIKVAILGSPGVGKSTYMERIINGGFIKEHVPTPVDTCRGLSFNTSAGVVNFILIEKPSSWIYTPVEDTTEEEEDNWIENSADAAIILYTTQEKDSLAEAQHLVNDATSAGIPYVVCRNKFDIKVPPRSIARIPKAIEISAKSNYQFERPFLFLIRELIDKDANFIEGPAFAPPTVVFDAKYQAMADVEV